jgi:predicted permease
VNAAGDVRRAVRGILKNPRIFALTVGVLGLGIGATIATLSIVDGVFFRPLPGLQRSQELVALYTDNKKTAAIDYGSLSYVDYLQYRRADAFSDLSAYAGFPMTLDFGDATERVPGEVASGNYFAALGVHSAIGRIFSDADDLAGSSNVAVISYRLWASRFGKASDVIGRTVRINGHSVAIIGVAPEGFLGTNMDWVGRPDIWLPMAMQPQLGFGNLLQAPVPWCLAIGRLRNGVGVEQAQANLESINSDLKSRSGRPNRDAEIMMVLPINEARFFPAYRSRLALFTGSLAGISGLTLLIAAFNVANLLLARLLGRSKEFAIKLALGAKPWRLVRQVVVENSLVVMTAAAGGLWIASWTPTLLGLFPRPFQLSMEVPAQVGARTIGLALLLAIVLVFLLSASPLLHLSYRRLSSALKSGFAIPHVRFGRMSVLRLCLLLQVAVAMVLAATAGLNVRSVRNLSAVDPEFRPEGLIVSNLDLASLPLQRRGVFLSQLQDALHSMPSVASSALAAEAPLGGGRRMRKIRRVNDQATTDAVLSYVTAGYFELVGMAIREGKEYGQHEDDARALIINDVVAQRYWPGQPAVGRYLHIEGETTDREVRAVVQSSKCVDITDERQPCLYLPLPQTAPQAAVVFKPRGDAASALGEIRNQVRRLDTGVALYETRTLREHLQSRFSGPSLLGGAAAILALIGVVILTVGVFALVSFTITQTSRNIGIRIAIGATRSRIIGEFLLQIGSVVGIGVAIGMAVTLSLSPILRNQLFQISPQDPAVLAGAVILLVITSLGACTLAARRAARIDPAVTLRNE